MATSAELARVGPFVIESVLGRGSWGTVYRARHADGRVLAVKAVGQLDGHARKTLRREIEELSRVSHPGVVRIRAHDTEAEPPYYAMDLVEGETLAAWGARQRPGPLAPADARAIARLVGRLCETLAHLHAAGLVHRDLNPDNVMVNVAGDPVLVDFGLCARFPGAVNRESLPVDVEPAGRLPYMAPEVIRGELIDARADLYSVGCMLYELLTGEPPFAGTIRAVLDGHLSRALVPPRARRAGIPAALEQITLGLLAKEPSGRHAHAADLAERLLGFAGEPSAGRPLPPLLHRPRLVGRVAELAWADELLARARGGQGGVAAVAGDSGIGKTRFLMEVSHRALARGFAVFAGTCETGAAAGAPLALAGLRAPLAALADVCTERGPGECERVFGARGKVLAAFEPSLARMPGQDAHPAPAPLAADGTRQRILDALTEALLAAAEVGPVLLLVDDLQWADDLTLEWLAWLARGGALARTRVLVIASARAHEGTAALARLATAGVTARRLPPFAAAELVRLSCDMLGTEALDDAFAAALAVAAEGNPLFVTEYVQLALAAGALAPGPGGYRLVGAGLALPRTVSEVVRLRLGRLSAGARALAEYAAVWGAAVPRAALAVDPAGPAGIEELLGRRVLTTEGDADAGGGDEAVLRFSHDKLREVLYEGLPPERRRVLHRAAGEAIEAELAAAGPGRAVDAVLGQHFLAAGDPARALDYFARAAEAAVATYSNREAAAHLTTVLALDAELGGTDVLRRARWLRWLGTAENALGAIDASRSSFAGALALLGHPFPVGPARLLLGVAIEAGRCLGRALARRPRARPPVESARLEEALLAHQGIGYLMSDATSVLYNCVKMYNLAARGGAAPGLTRASATMGLALGLVPLKVGAAAAAHFFRAARRAAAAAADPESEAWALLVEGYYRLGRGELADAGAALETGRALAAGIGNLRRRDECLVLLAEIAILRADAAAATRVSEEALASARARADVQAQFWAQSNLARVALALGDAARARACLAEAADFVQTTVPADRVMLAGLRALTEIRLGDRSAAWAHARAAAGLLSGADSAVYYTAHGVGGAAEALLALAEGAPPTERAEALALARRCLVILDRHARRHPVARARYQRLAAARGH